MQLVCVLEHVLQGDVQGVHTLFTGTSPAGQLSTQSFPSKFLVLQAVQLEVRPSQVRQSPVHASAMPDTFTYPTGVVAWHTLFRNT